MTREEALAREDRVRYNLTHPDDKAAVDMAFEALRVCTGGCIKNFADPREFCESCIFREETTK